MSKELAESSGTSLNLVTRADVDALKAQRELLREFVSSQLREAQFDDSKEDGYGEGDYGKIPGTKKNTLLKPGAEKLNQLFHLGSRMDLVDKEIDRYQNLAMFSYKCTIFSIRTGKVIAECIGSANSQEVKYRERTVWKKKKTANGKSVSESTKEETPIFDILNTLQKMAQKRAYVGATIIATASSDYFAADFERKKAEQPEQAEGKDQERDVTDTAEATSAPPICCGKEMMVSKYPDRETGEYPWYCLTCKSKKPRAQD